MLSVTQFRVVMGGMGLAIAGCGFMAYKAATEASVQGLVDGAWSRYEQDGDGVISLPREERSFVGSSRSGWSGAALLRAADNKGNGNGSVLRDELQTFVNALDDGRGGATRGDGKLTRGELDAYQPYRAEHVLQEPGE